MFALMIVIGLFTVAGIVFSLGKGSFLIAGFNTMPKKEKAKYDKVALCKFMGKIMFAMVGCLLFWLADYFFPYCHLFAIGQILLIAVLIFALVYANTKKRFLGKKK